MTARVRLGAVCWVLTVEFFIGQAVAQAAWRTPYSMVRDYVSDLGAAHCGTTSIPGSTTYICSPLDVVMNAAFVAFGVLVLFGAVLTASTWPRRGLTWAGLVFLVLLGLGKILVGLAPEDVHLGLHLLGALGIPAGNLAVLLLGAACWPSRRGWAVASWVLGGLGLIGFLLQVGAPHVLGVGTAERLAESTTVVWLMARGAVLLLRPEPSPAAHAVG